MMVTDEGLRQLLAYFDTPPVKVVLLVGSYARGDAGPYSDVDLLRHTPAPLPNAGTHLWEGKLVNVSDAVPEAVEAWFVKPERAVDTVAGYVTRACCPTGWGRCEVGSSSQSFCLDA